jgi:hypothetical protein
MLGPTAELMIPVEGDEALVVTYRRSGLTPRLQAKLADIQRALALVQASDAEAMPSGEALLGLCELYAQMIVSWNLTADDGVPIGTDADSLADVDFGTLNMVAAEIGRATSVDPLRSGGSSNGSLATGDSEPLRITTAS